MTRIETDMRPKPLEATVMGSWPIPGWYEFYAGSVRQDGSRFGRVDREEAVRDAVGVVVADQLGSGLERVTDGEVQRVDFNLGFYDYLQGIQRLSSPRLWGAPGHDQRGRYTAMVAIEAPDGLGCVEEYRRFRQICPTKATKMPVPGPFTLAGCIGGGSVYESREAVTEALLPIVRKELIDLVAAGVDFIQLDEPSFACHPQEADYFLDVVRRTLAGIPVYTSMHMCFGNYRARAVGWRSYAPLFPAVGQAAVSQLAFEFASREMTEISLLKQLPETMDVAVGLVDVKNTWVEPVGLIVERIEQVLAILPPERVSVTPDCGFSQTPRHVALGKAVNMVQAVRQVRAARGLAE